MFVLSKINIIIALTNILAILPYSVAEHYGDNTTCTFITLATVSSGISHLLMSHKHGLPGFALSLVWRIAYLVYPHYSQLKDEYFFTISLLLAISGT